MVLCAKQPLVTPAAVLVPVIPLPLQLPVDEPGQAAQQGPQGLGQHWPPMWDTWLELLAPGFDLTQP